MFTTLRELEKYLQVNGVLVGRSKFSDGLYVGTSYFYTCNGLRYVVTIIDGEIENIEIGKNLVFI